MEGGLEGANRGIIPRSAQQVFQHIEEDTRDASSKWLARCSFCQIYNEKISDLLVKDAHDLKVRESADGGVHVEGLKELVVRTPADVYKLLNRGRAQRQTNSTKMNATSSRSHAVFTIVVEHSVQSAFSEEAPPDVTVGKLRLVDLAGSERFEVSNEAKRQAETVNINTSLTTFGKVVLALTTRGNSHVLIRFSSMRLIFV